MNARVVDLWPGAPHEEFEEVDASPINTAKRSMILGYKLGSLFLSQTLGVELPGARNPEAQASPVRHVELSPDKSLTIETRDGHEHFMDIYNFEALDDADNKLPPLLMIMPLSLPHDRGFQAPVIDMVQEHCRQQNRPMLVISSEGFADKRLSAKQVLDLDFDQMASNIHECLDILSQRLYVDIPEILVTGGSRGGTLSLLAASTSIAEQRGSLGLSERKVSGVLSFAPAGLRPLDSLSKKYKVAKQFVVNEPFHAVRKASTLEPEDLSDYIQSLYESVPPKHALAAIGRTGLLFLTKTPLENIGRKLSEDQDVWVLTMKNDGITTPKYWQQELGHLPKADVKCVPGHHLSIDSTRKIALLITRFLDQNLGEVSAQEQTQVP